MTSRTRFPRARRCSLVLCGLAGAWLAAGAALAQPGPPARSPAKPPAGPAAAIPPTRLAPSDGSAIVATVNGEVISQGDVDNRRRLFALSTGLSLSPEVLDRLTPQVIRQLVDERLRLQEMERRHIVVTDKEIAEAIAGVERNNNMAPGALRQRLSASGVDMRTLIDQTRVQIGWGRVLRQVLGDQVQITDADIKAREDLLKAQVGQPEFNIGEIFIPVADPSQEAEAQRFSDTVITQLRAGAPFAMVAAQFSQSQTALQGGDLGWVQPNELDPGVVNVLQEMPVGAVSNPVRVPGGFLIVTLRGKRVIGQDPAIMVKMRQIFFRFTSRLDQNNPTAQQRDALEKARHVAATVQGCDAMEAASKAAGDQTTNDPGPIRLETVAVPALRQLMATLPPGKASQPLVAEDGVAVIMVCSRDQQNLGLPDRKELSERILNDRVEQASRQLMRELQRRAMINRRS